MHYYFRFSLTKVAVLFQFGGLQDLDVVSQANVESSHAHDLIDLGVEVPDVVVALVGLNLVI